MQIYFKDYNIKNFNTLQIYIPYTKQAIIIHLGDSSQSVYLFINIILHSILQRYRYIYIVELCRKGVFCL